MGANFREKLERSLEIIFVVLNFVVIRSRIRDDIIYQSKRSSQQFLATLVVSRGYQVPVM